MVYVAMRRDAVKKPALVLCLLPKFQTLGANHRLIWVRCACIGEYKCHPRGDTPHCFLNMSLTSQAVLAAGAAVNIVDASLHAVQFAAQFSAIPALGGAVAAALAISAACERIQSNRSVSSKQGLLLISCEARICQNGSSAVTGAMSVSHIGPGRQRPQRKEGFRHVQSDRWLHRVSSMFQDCQSHHQTLPPPGTSMKYWE